MKFVFILIIVFSLLIVSCGSNKEKEGNEIVTTYVSTVNLPSNTDAYTYGNKIPFEIVLSDSGKTFKNLIAYIDGKKIKEIKKGNSKINFDFDSKKISVGSHNVKIDIELIDGNVETVDYEFMLVSDSKPENYTYTIVKKYQHDTKAYTQGLIFENGFMYEGTGLQGKSELRYVDFKNNKILRSIKLDPSVFGEGIAIIGEKIYQLTWSSRKGYIYNKSDFSFEKQFTYPTEGWGLCYDGNNLILSDGTDALYFYNPDDFKLVKKINVADDINAVSLLNELEFINGEIWANVYQTNLIVRIDPNTGKIIAKIDLSGLLTAEEEMNEVDVLNGIAYDATDNKIYVTGKLWPWLFEINLKKNENVQPD